MLLFLEVSGEVSHSVFSFFFLIVHGAKPDVLFMNGVHLWTLSLCVSWYVFGTLKSFLTEVVRLNQVTL